MSYSRDLETGITPIRVFKCALLGQPGCGKTSIVMRHVRNFFSEYTDSTIGAAFLTSEFNLDFGRVRLEIWDTAGQERYASLMPMYYRNSSIIVVVYNITDYSSFERAKKWTIEIKKDSSDNPVFVLVGNKSDLESKRSVSTERARSFASENDMMFIETSAKTSRNVNQLFVDASKRANERYKELPASRSRGNVVDLNPANNDSKGFMGNLLSCFGLIQ